ncbi:hypothetical protein Dsin_008714 [Dipteronia sinensis]|uniref:Reverse transcriptase domain-containing protein n=1 Tax=Dipteronia sinensis TaxID=43782 RepID=A0AAE0AQB0_9ROSI|nr:hypothetical protein Dsin_008714 [Dipteronia sinensis]
MLQCRYSISIAATVLLQYFSHCYSAHTVFLSRLQCPLQYSVAATVYCYSIFIDFTVSATVRYSPPNNGSLQYSTAATVSRTMVSPLLHGITEDPMSLEASLSSSPQTSSTTAFYLCILGTRTRFGVWGLGSVNLKPGVLRLQPWVPDFNPTLQKSSNVQVWVRFYDLSWEYRHPKIIFYLARGIGVPLRLDKATIDSDSGHYARVLVDVDMSTLHPSSVLLERDEFHSSFISAKYENLPSFCSICSSVRHLPGSCHWNKSKVPTASAGKSYQPIAKVEADDLDSHGLAQRTTMAKQPMVAFDSISARFWSSLGLHLVGMNDRDGLIPSIWVFACDSISDPQIVLCDKQHLTVSISIGSLMHWYTFVYASTSTSFWVLMSLGFRSPARGSCEDFKSMIEDCNLIGVRSQGAHFTWVRVCSSRTRVERILNRTLVSEGCTTCWRDISCVALPRRFSDHCPLWIQLAESQDLSTVDEIVPSLVSQEENSLLVAIPSADVICDAVFAMDALSALGPAGFSGRFFQCCWEIVSRDVILTVPDFLHSGVVTPGLNSNFIVLLPKMRDSITIDQFRPIVLGNFLFKFSSKILAGRDRHVEDCIAFTSDCVNVLYKKCYGGNVAMKIDFRKAFDTLDWKFLCRVLRAFGFSQTFIDWIVSILGSLKLSVLINGSPAGYFGCSRRVRKGGPLSPPLFGMAEDFLSRLLSRMVASDQLLPISSPRGFSAPTHLLYAYDVLIFCRGTVRNLRRVVHAFRVYGSISGQLVNWSKSSIFFGSSVSPARISSFQFLVGMQIGRLPFSYLGVPICRGKPRKSVLMPIADKILSKFSKWKDLALLNDFLLRKLTWKFINLNNFALTFLRERENSQRDVWRDNWLGVPILDLVGIPDFLAMHFHARVSDFIRDGRWILDDRFPARFPDLCFRIGRIAISPVIDYLVWPHSREGSVSCKAAYSRMFHDIPQVRCCRDVWSRYIPPSRSVLSWRLLLDRLPTEDRLCRFGFQLASRCIVCGASSESVDHLFLKCPLATALLEAVFSVFQRRVSTDTWGSFFSADLSLVWHSVYDMNHLGIGCMRNCVDDLLILHRFGLSGRPGKAPVFRSVVWSPPAPGWTKLNTDGAALGSPAINYAWNLGWHRIWLGSDSSYVVQFLSIRSDQVNWRVRQAWQCSIDQISHMEFQVSYLFKEGNQVADALSKHALGLSSDSWWPSTPSFCSSLVGNNCMGRESFRFS